MTTVNGQTVFRCIDVSDARPIRQPSRRLPLDKQAEVNEMMKYMEERGVEESKSPWSSAVVFVRKKNGNLCF
jgi:hypothetical protein